MGDGGDGLLVGDSPRSLTNGLGTVLGDSSLPPAPAHENTQLRRSTEAKEYPAIRD